MAILAFDIGGTSVKYGIWQGDSLSDVSSFPTPSSWQEMKNSLLTVKQQFEQTYHLEGVAFSAPGAVDSQTGVISGISAVAYIHHFPIVADLEEWLELPVSMENDANCAALAEVYYGVARDVKNCYIMVIGTGIGGALVIDRKLIRGKHLFGGEVGYLLLDRENTLSRLGSPVQMTQDFQKEGQDLILTEEIFDLAEAGDQEAKRAIENLYDCIARGLHTILVTVDPDCIVIGGGLSERRDLLDNLRRALNALLEQTCATAIKPDLRICQYRNQANLIGAVVHFEQGRIDRRRSYPFPLNY